MTEFDNGHAEGESNPSSMASIKSLAAAVIWFAGLISTIYLAYSALLLLFYAIVFMNDATPDFTWSKTRDLAVASAPLICFGATGFAGLRLWPHRRLRLWGLSAIVFQTGMAVRTYARPEGFLDLIDWLS